SSDLQVNLFQPVKTFDFAQLFHRFIVHALIKGKGKECIAPFVVSAELHARNVDSVSAECDAHLSDDAWSVLMIYEQQVFSRFDIHLELIDLDYALPIAVKHACAKDKRLFVINQFDLQIVAVTVGFSLLLDFIDDILFLKQIECIDYVDVLPEVGFEHAGDE